MTAPSTHPFRTVLGCVVLFVVLIIKVAASVSGSFNPYPANVEYRVSS